MAPGRTYMFDNAAAVEYQRLDLMSKILDPWTRGYMAALGIGPGWHCLELGGGNGSISEWLCEMVGPAGSVTSVDIKPVLLDLIPNQNLTVQQLDIRSDDLPAGSFDLVSCRAVLHQISEDAEPVLAKLAAAVKPGGWLLVQEPDFHLAPTTEPETWAAMWRGIIDWGLANGVDWYIGRRLPGLVAGLGLGHPGAKTDVQNIRGTDRGALYFQLFFDEVRDRVVGSGHVEAATYDGAAALLAEPEFWTQCWMMTAVWLRGLHSAVSRRPLQRCPRDGPLARWRAPEAARRDSDARWIRSRRLRPSGGQNPRHDRRSRPKITLRRHHRDDRGQLLTVTGSPAVPSLAAAAISL